MPWNNPIALPAAKIAAAVADGNGVVLAPSALAAGCAQLLHRTWCDAGLPRDLVRVVPGGAAVGRAVVTHPGVDGVALTGSVAVGREVAAACARRGVPLQAELGGNNAAVVLADADLAAGLPTLVRGAFSFAGQRCTAVRRLVVPRSTLPQVRALIGDAVASVVVGDPAAEATDMGPLVSMAARDAVADAIEAAVARGAVVVARGTLPGSLPPDDAWLAPAAVLVDDPRDPLVQQESFGPVLVVQPADDLDEAIALANGVDHGLLMAVVGSAPEAIARVVDAARVGIVSVGAAPPAIHPDAPFGGWKASGFGPPEHGEWDRWFFGRVQAVYGRG
jgi:acyl-CoA reductase-like NAD-dependent aldehyde dehydrogenase